MMMRAFSAVATPINTDIHFVPGQQLKSFLVLQQHDVGLALLELVGLCRGDANIRW
jgi:hypothetical protein